MPTSAPAIEFFPGDDQLAAEAAEVQLRLQYSPRLVVSNTTDTVLWDYSYVNSEAPFRLALSGGVGFYFTNSKLTFNVRFNRMRMHRRGGNLTVNFRGAANQLLKQWLMFSAASVVDFTWWGSGEAFAVEFFTTDTTADNLAIWYVEPDSPISDPYWDQVPLLLDFEGPDGSTAVADKSKYGRTVTPSGNFQIDTAQFKYGASSGYFDGTNSKLDVALSADFAFLPRFTIEGYVRFDTLTGSAQTILSVGQSPTTAPLTLGITAGGNWAITAFGISFTSAPVVANTWYHVAVVRSGYTVRFFVLGGSAYELQGSYVEPGPSSIRFGANDSNAQFFKGWLDNWRITNDVDRYGEDFTPFEYWQPPASVDVEVTLDAGETSSDTFSLSMDTEVPVVQTTLLAQEAAMDSFEASAQAFILLVSVRMTAQEANNDDFHATVNAPSQAYSATSTPAMAFEPTPKLKIDPIDKFIFEGVQSRFLEVFNVPTVWTTSTDETRALDRLFDGKDRKNQRYPYAFLKMGTWDLPQDRLNNRGATLRGIPVSQSTDGKSYLSVKFLPMNFQVGVKFVTNSFREVVDFARGWMIASKAGYMSFQVEYGLTVVNVTLVMETSITFPQREGSPEEVQEYVAEVGMLVQGHISEPEVKQQVAVDEIELSLALGAASGVTDSSGPQPEVFWSFSKSKGETT